MREHFLRYSWGLILIVADIRLNHFDILPDVIGYALICHAIGRLSQTRPGYRKGLPWGLLLLLLSLNEMVPVWGSPDTASGQPISLLLYTCLMSGFMWGMAYVFLRELIRHATDEGHAEWSAIVRGSLTFYSVVSAGTLVYMPFTLNLSPSSTTPVLIIVTILGLVAQIQFILICRRAAKTLGIPNLVDIPPGEGQEGDD